MNELDASLDLLLLAGTFDHRRIILVDLDLLGSPQIAELDIFQLDAQVLEDGPAAGEDSQVFQHGLATVAVSRCLDGRAFERATQLVDHQRRQGLAFNFLGDDQDRLTGVENFFQDGNEVLVAGDLLLVDKDVRVLQLAFHLLRIGYEIRRQITAVELHAFDEFVSRLDGLAFLDRDDAVLADSVHGLGDDAADLAVVVGGHGGHVLHVFLGLDRNAQLLELLDDVLDGLVDATLHEHGVGA